MEPVAYVFGVLQHFEKILRLIDSLQCALQDGPFEGNGQTTPGGGGSLNKHLYREALPRDSNPYPLKY